MNKIKPRNIISNSKVVESEYDIKSGYTLTMIASFRYNQSDDSVTVSYSIIKETFKPSSYEYIKNDMTYSEAIHFFNWEVEKINQLNTGTNGK